LSVLARRAGLGEFAPNYSLPNRNTSHEENKLDHSTHPTTRSIKEDLRAPGATPAERSSGEHRDKTRVPRERKSGGH